MTFNTTSDDRLIQGMACGGNFRILAAQTTTAVETIRERLDLSPIAADAMGRAMTASVLLARLLEKSLKSQRVTLRFDGKGPLGTVIGEGSLTGEVRGYVGDPQYASDDLSVGRAVGSRGHLTVVRGTPPVGKPYTSQVALVSGEIAKDVAQFLLASEQIPSAVLLGVKNRPQGVVAAGGVIIQSFPHASEEELTTIEHAIRLAPPLSGLLEEMPIEKALGVILDGVDFKLLDPSLNVPVRFTCSCTRQRALAPLTLLPPEELREMMEQEGGSEVTCQFCGERYTFSVEELQTLNASHEA